MTISFTNEQLTTLKECLTLAIKSPSVNLDGAKVIVDLYIDISTQLEAASKTPSVPLIIDSGTS